MAIKRIVEEDPDCMVYLEREVNVLQYDVISVDLHICVYVFMCYSATNSSILLNVHIWVEG